MLVAMVSLAIASMMILPVMQYVNGTQNSSAVTYSYGNEYVQFRGGNAYLGFGNSIYPVSWSVYRVNAFSNVYQPFSSTSNSSPISLQSFTSHGTGRIENAYQNSAVMTESNANLSIAEIFTFMSNAIDASIAMENLNASNQTYISSFSISTGHHNHAFMGGFSPESVVSSNGMGNKVFQISKQDWSISTGNLTVNWENEASVFSVGAYYSSPEGSEISLPFGPLTLRPNETYSIDPIISSPPNGGTSGIPNSGAGGGGGSSGSSGGSSGSSGSTPQYPSLSNFQVTYASNNTPYGDVILGDTSLDFSVSYANAGATDSSPSVSVNSPDYVTGPAPSSSGNEFGIVFSAIIPGGIEPISPDFNPSGSGIQTFQWTAQPGYYTGFYVGMENGYGGTSASINRPAYVYTLFPYPVNNKYLFFPDAGNSGIVYNSNGIFTGIVSSALNSGINGIVSAQTPHSYHFSTGLWNQTRTLGVWSVSQNISFIDNSAGDTSALAMATIKPVAGYVQSNTGPANATSEEQTIWNSIAYGLDMAALVAPPGFDVALGAIGLTMSYVGPFIFSTHNTFQPNGYSNSYTFSETGTSQILVKNNYNIFNQYYKQYNLISGNDISLSYLFSLWENLTFTSASTNSSGLVMNDLMYSTQMTLMQVPNPNQGYIDEPAQLHLAIIDGHRYGYWTYPSPATFTTSVSLPIYILEN